MYEFSPVTPRIQALREKIRNRVIPVDSVRAVAITESYKRNDNMIPMIKRAYALKDVLEAMPLQVEEHELMVGSMGAEFCGSSIYPEWDGESWIPHYVEDGIYKKGEDGLYHTPKDDVGPLVFTEQTYKDLAGIKEFWKDHRATVPIREWQPQGFELFQELRMSSYTAEKDAITSPVGHLTPGHEKIINVGYKALRDQAQNWIDAHEGDLMADNFSKNVFYSAVVIVCDAVTTYIKRYAGVCRTEAEKTGDGKRRAELFKMAEGLEWISENPARNFWEACQAALLYQLVLQLEAGYPALSFGRFDQYTWPFLKKELDEGSITRDEAQEIVDSVFLKLHSLYRVFPPIVTASTGVNTYYHTTIGGEDPETGEDSSNLITFMVLESLGRLKLHDPTISLRVNSKTPDKLWECALETSKLVGGLPLFQNDDVIIPSLQKEVGFELKDARNYSLIGCQEIVGSGNDFPAPNGYNPPHCSIHYGTVLAMALNDGKNPVNGVQSPIHTGFLYEMKSIDEVKEAFEKVARYGLHWLVSMNNYTEYLSQWIISHPLLSMSMEGCMESGKDIVQGGCKYNSFGGTATGLATIVDSLSAIKYMCFDNAKCTTREMYDAVMANWEGYEPLRQQIINEVPHYGNGDPGVDAFMTWVQELYIRLCSECSSSRSKKYKSGLYGATDHINQGYRTWATPDGRKFGEPIADAASPAQGRDKNGPAAIFKSACCFDHHKYINGMALNIRMHPSVMSNDEGTGKLRDITKNYFKNGGMEVQYNVIDSETLRKAQKDPDEYRDLVVRIAGFSAYFVDLNTDQQNDIISRHENMI